MGMVFGDATEAMNAVMALRPGESMVYYRGELGHDGVPQLISEMTPAQIDAAMVPARAVRTLALAMLQAGTRIGEQVFAEPGQTGGRAIRGLGLGHLTQRRVGKLCFEYIFTRARVAA